MIQICHVLIISRKDLSVRGDGVVHRGNDTLSCRAADNDTSTEFRAIGGKRWVEVRNFFMQKIKANKCCKVRQLVQT